MKVTIDRAKWNVGERLGCPGLLNFTNGAMCCLGFLCSSYGIDDEDLEQCGMPSDLPEDQEKRDELPAELFRYSGSLGGTEGVSHYLWEDVFASFNDDKNIDDATRESWIAEGFRTVLGVEVEFIGEYPNVER